jgi:hypothetical protein
MVERSDGCWTWKGARGRFGYGQISVCGRAQLAHRVAYELHTGPIPDGMFVCHHCDNPGCVNPAHLFLGFVRRGEHHPSAKLTSAAVADIRERLSRGEQQTCIARLHGISASQVTLIKQGESWRGEL